jgi:kinetochore protein Spc7/SPC105
LALTNVTSLEVEALRAEVTESKSQIEWLEERIAESKSQKQEAAAAISEANRLVQIQKSSTSAEVFRLKGE